MQDLSVKKIKIDFVKFSPTAIAQEMELIILLVLICIGLKIC